MVKIYIGLILLLILFMFILLGLSTCQEDHPQYHMPNRSTQVIITPLTPVAYMAYMTVDGDTVYSQMYYAKPNEMDMAMYATRLAILYYSLGPLAQNEFHKVQSFLKPVRINNPPYVERSLAQWREEQNE